MYKNLVAIPVRDLNIFSISLYPFYKLRHSNRGYQFKSTVLYEFVACKSNSHLLSLERSGSAGGRVREESCKLWLPDVGDAIKGRDGDEVNPQTFFRKAQQLPEWHRHMVILYSLKSKIRT